MTAIKPTPSLSRDDARREAAKVQAFIQACDIVREAIETAGPKGIPSGHLYAMLMEFGISKAVYDRIIEILKGSDKITESGFVLRAVIS